MASTTVFGDSSVSLHPGKSQYYASEPSLRIPGYDNYLSSGPNSPAVGSDIELSRLDSMQEPLLSPRTGYYQHQGGMSQHSVATPPSLYQESMTANGSREAPLHRPQGSFGHTVYDSPEQRHRDLSPSGYAQPQQYPPQQQQYPPQGYHQQYPSQQSLPPGTPNSQRSMSPGPQRMMTPNPQQRSMSPGPQRMMTPNPQQQRVMTPNPQQQWGPQQPPNPQNGGNMAGRGTYRG
jgi:hypothetical protein